MASSLVVLVLALVLETETETETETEIEISRLCSEAVVMSGIWSSISRYSSSMTGEELL